MEHTIFSLIRMIVINIIYDDHIGCWQISFLLCGFMFKLVF